MTTVTDKKPARTGRRPVHRRPRWMRARNNPLYALPPAQFYTMIVYRLLIASMISTVFIVGMITDKG